MEKGSDVGANFTPHAPKAGLSLHATHPDGCFLLVLTGRRGEEEKEEKREEGRRRRGYAPLHPRERGTLHPTLVLRTRPKVLTGGGARAPLVGKALLHLFTSLRRFSSHWSPATKSEHCERTGHCGVATLSCTLRILTDAFYWCS